MGEQLVPEDDGSGEMNEGGAVFLFWQEGRGVCRLVALGFRSCCVVRGGRGRMMRARGLLPMWLRLRLRVQPRLGALGKRRIRVCGLRLLREGSRLCSAGYKYELDTNEGD